MGVQEAGDGACEAGQELAVGAALEAVVGLLDDLLVVSAALSRLLNHVHPDVVRSAWPGKGDALHALQRVSRWSERVFRGRLRRLQKG